jgi:hypothetical protein
MQDQELAAKAGALATRFRERGIIAEAGLGGSVVITASDIEAETMLGVLEAGGEQPDAAAIRAAAEEERQQLIRQENERHASDTMVGLRRHRDTLAHIESVYRLRLSVLDKQEQEAGT